MSATTVRSQPNSPRVEAEATDAAEVSEGQLSAAEAAESAPESEAEASPADEAGSEAEAAENTGDDGMRLRIGAEAGYSWFDLGNNSGMDHGGPMFRLEAGLEVPFGDTFIAQANAFGAFSWAEHDLGFDTVSSFNSQNFGVNGRLGLSLFDDMFRITAGVDIGAAHVGADSCEDGLSCGALFTRNAQLYPMDSWGLSLGGELGVSFLRGAIGLAFRGGVNAGLNPSVDLATQPDAPSYGLNMPWMQVTANVDVMGIVAMVSGSSSSSDSEDEVDAEVESDSEREGVEGTAEESETEQPTDSGAVETPEQPAAPSHPTQGDGLAFVQYNLNQIQGEGGYSAQAQRHAAANDTGYDEFRAARRGNADEDRLRVLAQDVIDEAGHTIRNYNHVVDLIREAQQEARGLQGSDRTEARRAIVQMRRERNQLQNEVNQSFNRARAARRIFNRSASGEDLEIDFSNPIRRPSRGGDGDNGRSRPNRPTPNRPTPPPTPPPASEGAAPPPPTPGAGE